MGDTGIETAASSEQRMTTADLAQAMDAKTDDRAAVEESAAAAPLLPESESADLRMHWEQIQTGFVDDPRQSVEDADALVASAMQRLAEIFASERSNLEAQWDRGDDVSTEDLRIALQRYRSFFSRLLTI